MTAAALATWLHAHGAVFAVSHIRQDGTHYVQWSRRAIDACYQDAIKLSTSFA